MLETVAPAGASAIRLLPGAPHPRRAEALELVRGGMSFTEAARAVGATQATVSRWCRNAGVASGLASRGVDATRGAMTLDALRDSTDPYIRRSWRETFAAKIGLPAPAPEDVDLGPAPDTRHLDVSFAAPVDRGPVCDSTCPKCGSPAVRHPDVRRWTREHGWAWQEVVLCQPRGRRGCGVVVVSERPEATPSPDPTMAFPTPSTAKETNPMRNQQKTTPAKVDGNPPGRVLDAPKASERPEVPCPPPEAPPAKRSLHRLTHDQVERAVRMVLDEGMTNADAAKSLGCNQSTIARYTMQERNLRRMARDRDGDLPAVRLLASPDVREFLSLPQATRDAMVLLLGACAGQA